MNQWRLRVKCCRKCATVMIVAVCMAIKMAFGDVPSSYVGIWSGGRSGRAKEVYLVIRGDSTGGVFGISEKGEEFKAYEFDFETAGDRLKMKHRRSVRKGKRREYTDRDECTLCLDAKSDKLLMSAGNRTNTFERAEGMEDPFRRGVGKTRKQLVTGVWSGGSEFSAYSLIFAESGDAMMSFAVGSAMGKWSLTDDGNVNLRIDDNGVYTNLLVHYNATEDTMQLGDNIQIGRIPKISPDEVVKPLKEKIAAQQRDQQIKEQQRRDKFWANKTSTVTTNNFETIDEIFNCLLAGRDESVIGCSISIETGVEGLFDTFSVRTEDPVSGHAHFATSYSENGPRPKEANRIMGMGQFTRPRGMPDPQRTFSRGAIEIRNNAKTSGIVHCANLYTVCSFGEWRSWTESLLLRWPLGKGLETDVARLLQPRFEGRFPCKGAVVTIRKTK